MRKRVILISLFLLFLFWFLFPENHLLFPQKVFTQVDNACRHLNKGEIDQAIDLLEKELKVFPYNLNAHLYLGIAYYLKKDFEKAFKKFESIEKAIEKRVDFDSPAKFQRPKTSGTLFEPEDIDAKLIEYWKDGKADVLFSEEIKALLYFFRGLSLKEKKDLKNAEKRFKKARKLNYEKTALSLQLIDLYLKKKDTKSASKELAEFKKISGESQIVIFLESYLQYKKNDLETSLAGFEKIAEKMPRAKKNMGRIHYNRGEYQKAIDIWEGILSQQPDDKEVQINLGRAYFQVGDSGKAQEYFDKVGLKISPARYSPKKISLIYNVLPKEVQFDLQCK